MFDLFHSLDNLHNILIVENVIFANSLWLMFHRGSPNEGVFQVLDDSSTNLDAEILNGAVIGL